jgi:hypothetical protein
MTQRRRLTLRSRNHLDQNCKLSPHRFIFDGGVGAQQSEAENAVGDEQAVDVWFLAFTMAELGRTRPRFGLLAHGEIILQPKGDGKGGLGDFYSILWARPH